jgi:hypothetical protein
MSDELRLGDVIDDYCAKCRRLTNHAIVSMMDGQVAKVRCRSCYHEHTYLHEQIPPSKKDLKKMELFNEVLAKVDPNAEAAEGEPAEGAEVTAPATDETPAEGAAKKKTTGRTKKA